MKRTNLIIDEKLLAEAKRLLNASSQSDTVNQALAQVIKLLKSRGIVEFFGTGAWVGDLEEMREDKSKPRAR